MFYCFYNRLTCDVLFRPPYIVWLPSKQRKGQDRHTFGDDRRNVGNNNDVTPRPTSGPLCLSAEMVVLGGNVPHASDQVGQYINGGPPLVQI